ncbi:MucB/RseB C-terminal domain-containing protein [Advenella sp. RU8]|uniref:MucB/RseB C-terminal domain-containing protein n=1 Tax=Advenella sp. RU8 TaxID=3399575 RepID=UPI003AAD742C
MLHYSSSKASRKAKTQWLSLVLLGAVFTMPSMAQTTTPLVGDDLVAFLEQVQKASVTNDYSGVFTYQQGEQIMSSRVTHIVDGEGVKERLELLDGDPQEYLRTNDVVQCLMPEQKKIVLTPARKDRFPAFLQTEPTYLNQYYTATLSLKKERVAGHECQQLELTPRSSDRYGYRLCVDVKTKLLLKSQTVGLDNKVVEQVAFTGLVMGKDVNTGLLAPSYKLNDWVVEKEELVSVDFAKEGWKLRAPEGYVPILSIIRPKGTNQRVKHLILSDGLSSISVFVQKVTEAEKTLQAHGAVQVGSLNVFRQRVDDYWVTAIGAVPMSTLEEMAVSAKFIPPVSSKLN